ncbi:hypothetical protein Tco_0991753 [Tanacetum coccineum]|uniref:Uncharacterized protein n=1 Tax=Tanacetum coccineum TaxID=301880 RepID=A0ABQ5F0H0_9ASTR
MSRRLSRLFLLLISLNPWTLRACGKNSNHLAALWMLSLLISDRKLRQVKYESNQKNDVKPVHNPHADSSRPNPSNFAPKFPSNQSYASVANGGVASKTVPNNGVQESSKSIQLNDLDLIKCDNPQYHLYYSVSKKTF